MERVNLCIRGSVQGVGFRWYAKRCAVKCHVTGWVMNRSDGSVTIVAEGLPEHLDAFITALRQGELGKNIAAVERQDEPARGEFTGFEIRMEDR